MPSIDELDPEIAKPYHDLVGRFIMPRIREAWGGDWCTQHGAFRPDLWHNEQPTNCLWCLALNEEPPYPCVFVRSVALPTEGVVFELLRQWVIDHSDMIDGSAEEAQVWRVLETLAYADGVDDVLAVL
jgi:hypothetical protein